LSRTASYSSSKNIRTTLTFLLLFERPGWDEDACAVWSNALAKRGVVLCVLSRFSSSRQAVRYSGLDVTVSQSDQRRAPGHISRQGPPALRWALYEAAQVARRGERSPDREYYLATKERIGGNRACIAVARKLLKRSYHTLRELGEEALAPA
jgi:Transposase IS116/IS110/IS902 family